MGALLQIVQESLLTLWLLSENYGKAAVLARLRLPFASARWSLTPSKSQ